MLCGVIVLFAIIVLRLFSLQIIHGEEYEASITASVSKNLPVPASRGGIYDRYGRPLAINTVAYSVQVDGSLTLELSDNEKQNLSKALMNWLWKNGHQQVNSLPISLSSSSCSPLVSGIHISSSSVSATTSAWRLAASFQSSL